MSVSILLRTSDRYIQLIIHNILVITATQICSDGVLDKGVILKTAVLLKLVP